MSNILEDAKTPFTALRRWRCGTGGRDGYLSVSPHARRGGAHDSVARRAGLGRDRRTRMGMGAMTAHTQVTADRLGVPLDKLEFRYGDSFQPGVVLAGGSHQTASIGFSVIAAQRALTCVASG